MKLKFILPLLLTLGVIVFLLITTGRDPSPAPKIPKQTKQHSELSSSLAKPAYSSSSSQSYSSGNNASSSRVAQTANSSSYSSAQNPVSLENMEPWADKPSPHMKSLGEPAKARATVNDKSFDLVPNQLGIFQRIYVASRAQIAVKVEYPKASTGDPITIQVQDGGQLDNGTVVQQGEIKDGNVAFHFRATENPGIHRVSLRKGSDVKTLDFWVGPPLPVRVD